MTQFTQRSAEPPALKLQLGISGVRDDDRQHPLMNIYSRQIILNVHVFSLWRKTENARKTFTHPHVLSPSATHTHRFNHAFQIKHHHGLNSSSVTTTLPLSAAARISKFS